MADTPTQTETQDPAPQDPSEAEMIAAEEATVEAGDPDQVLEEREYTQDQIDRRAREVGIKPELFEENEYTLDENEAMLAKYEETLSEIE